MARSSSWKDKNPSFSIRRNMDKTEPLIKELLKVKPQPGKLVWIGIRPATDAPVEEVASADVTPESGLLGDHFSGRPGSNRQVTLIQAEHLEAVGSYLNQPPIQPARVRRNLLVSGINLYPLRRMTFRVGGRRPTRDRTLPSLLTDGKRTRSRRLLRDARSRRPNRESHSRRDDPIGR